MNGIKKFFGDKKFYKLVALIVIPIMVQQLLLSLAGYIDNLMINSYDSEHLAYNGVSAANRLTFICYFVWLGVSATASIFIAQYFGAKNKDKVKESIRIGVYSSIIIGIISFLVMFFFGKFIINSYIQTPASREYGYQYLKVIMWSTPLTAFNLVIASSFRSIKKTILPLIAAFCGIIVNVILNYCLIFGHFGFPRLGPEGAALATLLSKVVETLIFIIVLIFTKNEYLKGIFHKFAVTKDLLKRYILKGLPLVANELVWSIGAALFAFFYTYHNDVWYNAYAYCQNISDLFFIIFAGLGNGTAVVLGSSLGQGDFEKAEKESRYFKALAIISGMFMGGIMVITAPYIVLLFSPDPVTKKIVIDLLRITAVFIAVYAYNAVCFFILRAGGDSVRAFILDQIPTYLIGITLAAFFGLNASRFGLTIVALFAITHVSDIAKIFVANYFVSKRMWLVNLTIARNNMEIEK